MGITLLNGDCLALGHNAVLGSCGLGPGSAAPSQANLDMFLNI